MAQLSTLLSLNTAPTSRSAVTKTPSLQSDKRLPEPAQAPEPASPVASETKSANEQTPVKAEKTRFEKLLEEGKQEQAYEQTPAKAKAAEPQSAPAQESAFMVLGLFGGNPLPLEGQTLPPAAATVIPEMILADADTQAAALAIPAAPVDALVATAQSAFGLAGAAPTSLFASSQSQRTLLDLDGPDPSLFNSASLLGNPLQFSSAQPAASLFADGAAASMPAANDTTVPNGLFLPQAQPVGEGAAVVGGLQQIMGGAPMDLTEGLNRAVANPVLQPGTQPALQQVVTGVIPPAQSVSTGSGVDAPTTPAQADSATPNVIQAAANSVAQVEISSDKVPVLVENAGAGATAASVLLPEAKVSDPAATAQAATETTNAQGQTAEIAWQPDAAERARAWRGISTLDPFSGLTQGLAQGVRHEFSVNYTSAGGQGSQGGQLQQFAESLRQAGSSADAGLSSILQAGVQSGATSTTAQTADRGASAFNASAPGPESQQAWRVDSAATGVSAAGSRGAAGTLNFAQGMQASSFGQPLGQSFGDSEWAESVTKRVALMAGQKVSSAQIELDPPELGAMTVRISVTGDQANVMFTSAHAQVREALEQTFTRLQDMLGQQGLQLADAQVSDQSAARQQQGEGRSGQGGGVFADEGDAGPVTLQSLKVPKGLVDYYA